jgi:hypothetical protein
MEIRVVTTCNVNGASFSHAFWQTQDLQYLLIGYTMRPWPATGVVRYPIILTEALRNFTAVPSPPRPFDSTISRVFIELHVHGMLHMILRRRPERILFISGHANAS